MNANTYPPPHTHTYTHTQNEKKNQETYVSLSDKPTGTVTVTTNNAAGGSMFTCIPCTLTFNETNWNVQQTVYCSPIPGGLAIPGGTNIPVAFVASADSSGKAYSPGLLQVC